MQENMTNVGLDLEMLQEFADALYDRSPAIERDVARLRQGGNERELTADLFRAIHNIKGDAALCKFDLGVAIAHPVESLMSRFRDGEIPFTDLLAETILLSIDRLELATDALLHVDAKVIGFITVFTETVITIDAASGWFRRNIAADCHH